MKYLILVFAFVSFFVSSKENLQIIGEVSDKAKSDIFLSFKKGAELYELNLLAQTLPPNLDLGIYRIVGKRGVFRVYFTRPNYGAGQHSLVGKYTCPKQKCYLYFYEYWRTSH